METEKLYSPLNLYHCSRQRQESGLYDGEYTRDILSHEDAKPYLDAISAAVEKLNAQYGERGFMAGYTLDDLKDKVHSLIPYIELHNDKLWCVAHAELLEPLTPEEMDAMKDNMLDQLVNEWGQDLAEPIAIGSDKIIIEPYSRDRSFFIKTQAEFDKQMSTEAIPATPIYTVQSSQNEVISEAAMFLDEKLFSPIEFYVREQSEETGFDNSEYWDAISHEEAWNYLGNIEQAVKASIFEGERGLMEYYGSDTVNDKVHSLIPHVELLGNRLWCVAHIKLKEPLTTDEMSKLKEFWVEQLSDGWGEHFESHEIKVPRGELYLVPYPENKVSFFVDSQAEFALRMGFVSIDQIYAMPDILTEAAEKFVKRFPNVDTDGLKQDLEGIAYVGFTPQEETSDNPQRLEQLKEQLHDRIDENLGSYFAVLREHVTPETIPAMTKDIALFMDAHWFLKEYQDLTVPDLEFLLQFQSPLEVFVSRLPGTLDGQVDLLGVLACDGGILDEKNRDQLLTQFALCKAPEVLSMNDKEKVLIDRLDSAFKDFTDLTLSYDKADIMLSAPEIACKREAYEYFVHSHTFTEPELDFLLQLEKPLDFIYEKWQACIKEADIPTAAMESIFDSMDASAKISHAFSNEPPVLHEHPAQPDTHKKSVLEQLRQGRPSEGQAAKPTTSKDHNNSGLEL